MLHKHCLFLITLSLVVPPHISPRQGTETSPRGRCSCKPPSQRPKVSDTIMLSLSYEFCLHNTAEWRRMSKFWGNVFCLTVPTAFQRKDSHASSPQAAVHATTSTSAKKQPGVGRKHKHDSVFFPLVPRAFVRY